MTMVAKRVFFECLRWLKSSGHGLLCLVFRTLFVFLVRPCKLTCALEVNQCTPRGASLPSSPKLGGRHRTMLPLAIWELPHDSNTASLWPPQRACNPLVLATLVVDWSSCVSQSPSCRDAIPWSSRCRTPMCFHAFLPRHPMGSMKYKSLLQCVLPLDEKSPLAMLRCRLIQHILLNMDSKVPPGSGPVPDVVMEPTPRDVLFSLSNMKASVPKLS